MPVITTAEWQARIGEEGSLHEITVEGKADSESIICSSRVHRSRKVASLTLKVPPDIRRWFDIIARSQMTNRSIFIRTITTAGSDAIHHYNMDNLGEISKLLVSCDFLHFTIFSHRNYHYVQQTFSSAISQPIYYIYIFWRSIASNLGPDKMDKYPDKWTCRRTSSFQHVTYPADKW